MHSHGQIGSGTFGTVHKALLHGDVVAVKVKPFARNRHVPHFLSGLHVDEFVSVADA